ncbi:aryl-alcohol dehydrogenase-like predicted oxidoreductase [Alkalibacterium olivapovliticus]|uniref:Aryl-alcohol dehydrogenase-like predicted oxidoreductase n=1 Tax=Alkalibacterium olivapovliticus TaxID=99907 RepID=A0A2T0W5G9_9LACT|nr:aryl-alcohol dehydrogenase-like predicted oxidoreductase [Alkalibacterium olivapovliticus]
MEAGINFFDTANVYGGSGQRGRTEEIIGRWFAQGGGRREKVVLATKVYGGMEDETDGPNQDRGLSAYKIRRHLEESLKRLQTDHVELYQMHHIERHAPWEEIWGVFESLVNQGKTYYIGSSNFAGYHLALAQAKAEKRHFLGLVSEQHKYNLLCRLPELEVLPAAEDLGIGVIPWSPLGGGLLSGKILDPEPGSRSEQRADDLSDEERSQLEAYSKLCKDLGETEPNVALAWLLANPAVTAPIIGPRTMDQLEQALKAVEINLSEDVLKELDRIFPGPGGHAPEAYAW